jgi:acetyltransferase-like isoleucine patch superfamily enzyme
MLAAVLRRPRQRVPGALLQRVGGDVQTALWPTSRAALRSPLQCNPPPPGAFASFGAGSWIVPPARVDGAPHIEIGAAVVLMEHVDIRATARVRVGDGTKVARFSTIWATVGVDIGTEVLTSDSIAITDCWRPPGTERGGIGVPEAAPVVIEDGAYLGCGCFIGPGVTVGAGSYVGEGAVVLSDVPPHAVVYGNPARITRRWSAQGGWRDESPVAS